MEEECIYEMQYLFQHSFITTLDISIAKMAMIE